MWWLDNTKIPYNACDLYVEVEKFKEFCEKLNVDIAYLDTYEKYKLVYPVYRIFRPKEYLQTIFEQQYNNPEQISDIPEHYLMLFEIEYQILPAWKLYRGAELWDLINKGHPLDQAYAKNNPFVRKPDANSFIHKGNYKVTLIRKDGIKKEDYVVKDFYSPWQIYLLEEANQKFIRNVNVLEDFEKYKFHWNKSYWKLVQINIDSLSLIKWQDSFVAIWDCRFKENLVLSAITADEKGFFILEGEKGEKFYNERKKIAKNITAKFSYHQWIEFLKQLSDLYYQYKNAEKIKLSECVKKDIRVTIKILMMAFDIEYRKIIEDVGFVWNQKTRHIPVLEEIIPEWETFLKREAKFYLESILEDYNRVIPSDYQVSKDDIDQIIDYALKKGNETLLVSIIGINKEFFAPSYFDDERVWSYLRSLAVAVESWVKEIAGKGEFRGSLVSLTRGDFDTACSKLQKICGKTNLKIHSLSDLKHFLQNLRSFSCKKKSRDISWMKYLIRAYLIRNYIVHHTKVSPKLFGSTLIEFYCALIYLVFYTWKVKNP